MNATRLKVGTIVLDCPDPLALASFYAELLGWPVDDGSDDEWAWVVDPEGGPNVAFQRDEQFLPPTWPDRERQQMVHLDVVVAELDTEHERVVALGAKPLTDRQGTFRVYADPAGHTFCLCAC